ncbi:MAG TPA: hypothetical protein VNO75_08520 [Gemmatimonadaceae bacterium]|nr:hypothetical protein [Gemmatimonadaceae bacterium]
MDRLNRFVAQFYGYAVCLITVIVMLISIKGIIDAAFDLSDPIRAHGGAHGRSGRPLTNFELYKMEARREGARERAAGPTRPSEPATVDTVSSDAELRRMYEAEREAVIGNTTFQAKRSLFSGLLFIVLAGVLFLVHWRWLKGITSAPTTP